MTPEVGCDPLDITPIVNSLGKRDGIQASRYRHDGLRV